MSSLESLKQRAISAVDAAGSELLHIARTLHATPELGLQEHKAADLLCNTLAQHGFRVEHGIAGMDTAFRAEIAGSSASPTIAILAEYDALPKIGHACGHNLIATAAIGAGIALQSLIGDLPGRVLVLGTPAEETVGGKIIMLREGVFAGVDAAMMIHPSTWTMVNRKSLALASLIIEFTGKSSHAAGAPEVGINALEAMILTFNNINGMRLHLRSDARIHGVITNGGTVANVIPDYTSAAFMIRALAQEYVDELVPRVKKCAEAGALATGCSVSFRSDELGLANMIPNPVLARLFAANWRSIGVEVNEPRPNERMGSTDMGNVSHVLPALHPYIAIAPQGVGGHTVEFAAAANSPAGDKGALDAAKGLAMTTIDLLMQPALLDEAKREFAAAGVS